MSSQISITISIVSHGNADTVGALLTSMQQYEKDLRRLKIIITDNLQDDLPEYDRSPWGSLHIIRNTSQLGFAQNHNNAFKLAEGSWFAILNPDLVFERPVFDPLLDRLAGLPNTILAPHIMDETGHIQDSFRPLPTPFELIRRRLPGYQFDASSPDANGLIHPDWIAGMFWLMDINVYRQLGGMDERYRLYLEDVDFCIRARLQGFNVVVDSQVQIRHDAQRTSRRRLFYLMLHMQSAFRFFTSPVYRQAKKRFR